MAKIDGRTLNHKALEHIRILAVKRVLEDGEAPSDVMASLGLCRTTIYPWLRKYEDKGMEALVEKIAQGPEPKLTEKQRQQVKRWILGKDPRQYGFDFGLWSRRIVQALIQEKLGIELGLTAVGRLLASLEITPQKPLRRAYERDPAAVDLWIRETYPKLKKRAKRLGAKISSGRGGVSVRSTLGPYLWAEGKNARGQNLRAAAEPQCHQRGQRPRGILGGDLHRQTGCGGLRGVFRELHARSDRQSVLGRGRSSRA